MKYHSLRCRERAHNKRRKLRELGEAGLRFEREKERLEALPPYPDCESETLEMVVLGMGPGDKAYFMQAGSVGKIPEGCTWEVSGEIGTLTKL